MAWQVSVHVQIQREGRSPQEAAYDALLQPLPPAATGGPDEACLPRCADPDDQKFLQLALAARASWLLSKDKELLKLDRRTRRAGLFAILLPQDWLPAGC